MNKKNIVITILSVLVLTCILAFARTTTTDLCLVKPTWDESVDVLTDINANSDILEAFANDPLEFDTGERLEDRAGAMWAGNTETLITMTYQDSDNTIDAVVDNDLANYDNTNSNFSTGVLSEEEVEDYVGGMFTGNTETRCDVTYQDVDGTIDVVVDDLDTTLTQEEVDNFVNALINDTDSVHTRITITYDDTDNAFDFVVDDMNDDVPESGDFGNAGALEADGTLSVNTVDSAQYVDGSIDHEHLAADVISGMTDVTSTDADYILVWDATDSALKKVDMGEVRAGGYTNLTSFVDQTAWRVFYSNTAGDVTELALGADGTYLKSNGAAVAPTFAVPAGAGDVTKVGTPVDSQIGVWTGDGTIEGTANLTYDGSNLQLTGDIGSTGTRIAKGWFANLETTGDLTVNGTALASIYAHLGANTDITSIYNTSLKFGRDADNLIDFTTDNKIVFRVSAADKAEMISTGELDMNAGSIGFTQQTVTYNVTTTTVNWTLGNKATMTFGAGNIGTFAFTNPTNPCNVLLKIVQDATGSRVVTAWDADIMWVGGTAPTLTTTANAIDICSFYWDGTNYFGVASLAFAVP